MTQYMYNYTEYISVYTCTCMQSFHTRIFLWEWGEFQEITENPLPNIPVHILTGGRYDIPKKHRPKEYDAEAVFRSKIKHRILRWTDVIQSVDKGMIFYSGDAGHFVHYDDPELLISSVKIVLQDYQLLKEKEKK